MFAGGSPASKSRTVRFDFPRSTPMFASGDFVHHSRICIGSFEESVDQCGYKAKFGRLPLACNGKMYQPRCTHLMAVSSKVGELTAHRLLPLPSQARRQSRISVLSVPILPCAAALVRSARYCQPVADTGPPKSC